MPSVLALAHDARAQSGARTSDFDKYARFCSRKVASLRQSVGLVQPPNRAGKRFQRKAIRAEPSASLDDRHLQILLFDAERAWAQAQALRAQIDRPTTSNAKPGKARQHLARRLSRAADHATALATAMRTTGDRLASPAARLEAEAYALTLSGSFEFERSRFDTALERLVAAAECLSLLARAAPSSHAQALAYEMSDELEPLIRVAAYRLEIPGDAQTVSRARGPAAAAKLVDGWSTLSGALESEAAASAAKTASGPVTISWRGKETPIRHAELAGAIQRVHDAASAMERGKAKRAARGGTRGLSLAPQERALEVFDSVQALSSQLVADNALALSRAPSQRFAALSEPLKLADAWVTVELLATRMDRDALLVGHQLMRLARHAKQTRRRRLRTFPIVVKLLDGTVQSLDRLRDLSIIEEDPDLGAAVDVRSLEVRARRCIYLAEVYSMIDEHAKANALAAQAALYVRQAQALHVPEEADVLAASDDTALHQLVVTAATLSELAQEAARVQDVVGKAWFAFEGVVDPVVDSVPTDEADEVAALSLADPPAVKRGRKPTFYDITFNYVASIDVDAITARADGAPVVPSVATAPPPSTPDPPAPAAVEPSPAKRRWWFG